MAVAEKSFGDYRADGFGEVESGDGVARETGQRFSARTRCRFTGMDIGTASPLRRERAEVCHHLIDIDMMRRSRSRGAGSWRWRIDYW